MWTFQKLFAKSFVPLFDQIPSRAPSLGLLLALSPADVFLNPGPDVRAGGHRAGSCAAEGWANPGPAQASCEFETGRIYGLEILDPEMSLQGSERPEPIPTTPSFRSQGSRGCPPPPPGKLASSVCCVRQASEAELSCPLRFSHFQAKQCRRRNPSSWPSGAR